MTFRPWALRTHLSARTTLIPVFSCLIKQWGIPLHLDKLKGPSTCLTVLGIELDTLTLQAQLPQDKFLRIVALLELWSLKRHCTCKELESLTGNPQQACNMIPHTLLSPLCFGSSTSNGKIAKNINKGGRSCAIHIRFSAFEPFEENENPFSSIRQHLKNPLRKILIISKLLKTS